MTKNETVQIMAIITAAYPRFYEKLPERIKRVIGDARQLHDWALMDEATVNSVVASNFQRTYRARSETEKRLAYLPEQRQAYLREHTQSALR